MSATLLRTHTSEGWASSGVFAANLTTAIGSTLIASIGATGDNPSLVTDSANNEWVKIDSTTDDGALSQRRGQLWYCLNAQPINQLSVTTSGGQNVTLAVSEWSGVVGLRGYQMTVAQAGATTVAAEPGDMVFSACYYYRDIGSPQLEPESGWDSAGSVVRDNIYNSTAYRSVDESGQFGPLWNIGASARSNITAAFATTSSNTSTSNAYFRVNGQWVQADPYLRVNGEWTPTNGGV